MGRRQCVLWILGAALTGAALSLAAGANSAWMPTTLVALGCGFAALQLGSKKEEPLDAELELLLRYLEFGDAIALRTLQLKKGPFAAVAARLEQAEMQKAAYDWETTQRKRIAEDLFKAVEAASNLSEYKSTFLANMSHELRTPLNGVIGVMRLLMDTNLDARQKEYAGIVQTSAQSLLAVVNEILDYSKIEAGKMSVEMLPFDLRSTVEETVDLLAPQAAQKGIKLICDIDPRIGDRAVSDPIRIRQIVLNLLGNAIKFTHNGKVVVRLSQSQEVSMGIRLEIEDTGIGIEPGARERIFESFTQGDGGTTRRYGGTGLGLTISRKLVELLGGSLDFESEVGRGSRFWCEIPMEFALAKPIRQLVPVLVAIDDGTEFSAVNNSLEYLGYGVSRLDLTLDPAIAVKQADWVLADGDSLEVEQLARLQNAFSGRLVLIRAVPNGPHINHEQYVDRPLHASRFRRMFEGLVAGSLVGKRLAILDDDPIALDLMTRSLNAAGARVAAFRDPDGLANSDFDRYDAVLVDLQLEGSTALRVKERLEKRFEGAKWLVMSASFNGEQRAICMASGFEDCLLKPVSAEAVLARLTSMPAPLLASFEERPKYLAPIDASKLERQFEGDRAAVAEVLRKFALSTKETLDQIQRLAERQDFEGVAKLAHRLVGMSRTVGSEAIAEVAASMETSCKSGNFNIQERLSAARDALVGVNESVDTYLKRAA